MSDYVSCKHDSRICIVCTYMVCVWKKKGRRQDTILVERFFSLPECLMLVLVCEFKKTYYIVVYRKLCMIFLEV